MKRLFGPAAPAAAMMLCALNGARAADLDTTAPVLKAPSAQAPAVCTGVADFFTTACQLAAYGVRFYGTVDIGFGYQANATNFNKYLTTGLSYSPGKSSNGARWQPSPNALSQSNIGIEVMEWLGGGWSFVGQLETPFDPYSGLIPSGYKTQQENLNVPLGRQSGSNDTNQNGKWYSSQGFLGVSNDTFGTVTFLRQTDLLRDLQQSYDPFPGSQGYSIFTNGAWGGGGDARTLRQTTSVKYRLNYRNYRLGLFGQFGGYDEGNASRGQFQASVGTDFALGPGLVSFEAAGSYTRDGVSESLIGGAVNPLTGRGLWNSAPTTIQASISNNTAVVVDLKYTAGALNIYGGYERIDYAPPSDVPTTLIDITGYALGAGIPNTAITGTSFDARDKVLQVAYGGARYSVSETLDIVGAWYHSWQNDYSNGAATAGSGGKTTCAVITTAVAQCAGWQETVSALIKWQFAPKWELYVGASFTQLNGGLDSGYLSHGNWLSTSGLRFRW